MLISMVRMSLMKAGSRGVAALAASVAGWLAAPSSRQTPAYGNANRHPRTRATPRRAMARRVIGRATPSSPISSVEIVANTTMATSKGQDPFSRSHSMRPWIQLPIATPLRRHPWHLRIAEIDISA